MTKPIDTFQALDAPVFRTPKGTAFLEEPGVVLISRPHVNIVGMRTFLGQFDPALRFTEYVDDPIVLPDGTQLVKSAGQTCYCSWGPKRTMNADAAKYIANIVSSGHGSVLEHVNYSFFVYGISRSLTHEQVRHRVGWAYSQVSQRYVDATTLRFVMRPEFEGDEKLLERFYAEIDRAAAEYHALTEELLDRQQHGSTILSAEQKRDLRKKVQQTARAVLPNCTEAPITMTANARAWRHVMEMRASAHAEIEIRRLYMKIYRILVEVEPILFGDYEVRDLSDGTQVLHTKHPKV